MPDQNLEIIVRLVVASLLGLLIGLERERLLWTAGMRTHMLVATGSCLFMLVSLFGFSDVVGQKGVQLDPSRVAAQVVSGIGFLGAGTIIFRRDALRGLTTAASLWVVAAIGLAVGGGLYLAAGVTTFLALLILAVLKPLERRMFATPLPLTLMVEAKRSQMSLEAIESALGESDARTSVLQWRIGKELSDDSEETDESLVQINIKIEGLHESGILPLIESLMALPGVTSVSRKS